MLRVMAIMCLFASTAWAQVAPRDEALQEQLLPESFKLQASALAVEFSYGWRTNISYAITNNAGMNLYLGILYQGVSLGACTNVWDVRGALMLIPGPGIIMSGQPRGTLVPAGARIAGTITLSDCDAPNPGSPTAPLSLTLMVGKSESPKSMITFPLTTDAPVQQKRSQ